MKSIFIVSAAIFLLSACNNSEDKHAGHDSKELPKTEADSLMKEVDAGHMFGMGKMGKLDRFKARTQVLIDSIHKLPAKTQQALVPYKQKLDTLLKDLQYAGFAMDKWMSEFNMDSAVNNVTERIKYLKDEKFKVDKMKEAIVSSLNKADSLLR